MARGGKFIYALRATNGQGPVKIGCSLFSTRRLMQISICSPVPLAEIARIPGSHKDERALHDLLGDAHSHYEWFHPSREVMRVVAMMQAGADIADILATFNSCPFPRRNRGARNRAARVLSFPSPANTGTAA